MATAHRAQVDSRMMRVTDWSTTNRSLPVGAMYRNRNRSHSEGKDTERHSDTERRPVMRQTSTGQGQHQVVAQNLKKSLLVDSIGSPLGNHGEENVESEEFDSEILAESELKDVPNSKYQEIEFLKKQLLEKDKTLQLYGHRNIPSLHAVGGQNEDISVEYTQQRQMASELSRLHSIEEHEKRLQKELSLCRKEKDTYEKNVISLAEQLSKKEEEMKQGTNGLLIENERLSKALDENQGEIASLKKDLQRKEKNLKKLKEYVSKTVQPISDEQPQSLPASPMGLQEGTVEVEGLKQHVQTYHFQPSGISFGATCEEELAKLHEDIAAKDELAKKQLQKFEETAANFAAITEHNRNVEVK